jgi:transitional endoplasmic reticulum ATPase
MAIERTVEQAYEAAKGRAVAHLDPEGLADLNVAAGDAVALVGEERTVVTVAEKRAGDPTESTVRVDGFTRRNAGVDPGETVTIAAVDLTPAASVTLRPAAAHCCPIDDSHRPMVQNELLGTPVVTGEQVWVMVGPQQPFGVVVGSWRPLSVVETDPDGPVELTRATDLTIESAVDDVTGGTAAEADSWADLRESVFERDGRACRNCGVDFDTGSATLEAHFVVAPVHGGTVTPDNVVTLCRECHAAAHEHVTTPSV